MTQKLNVYVRSRILFFFIFELQFEVVEDKKTDRELISRWLEGDEKAFEQLFQRYVHKLYLYAAEQIGDNGQAKELVMDVMLQVWQNKEKCRNIHSMSAYLYGTVKHDIIDHYRKKALSMSPLEDLSQEPVSEEQPDTHLVNQEYQFILNKGIEQLTPQRRLVFMLKRKKNLSNKEIAENLNLSVKTVENHMTAAISFLRDYVNAQVSLVTILIVLFGTIQ